MQWEEDEGLAVVSGVSFFGESFYSWEGKERLGGRGLCQKNVLRGGGIGVVSQRRVVFLNPSG